jgi:hypothetical protein
MHQCSRQHLLQIPPGGSKDWDWEKIMKKKETKKASGACNWKELTAPSCPCFLKSRFIYLFFLLSMVATRQA